MNPIAQFIDVASELINLPIDPDSRSGVIANLEAIAEIARLVTEFPLENEVEPAAIFNPSFDEESYRV